MNRTDLKFHSKGRGKYLQVRLEKNFTRLINVITGETSDEQVRFRYQDNMRHFTYTE